MALMVNSEMRDREGPADVPLLWVVRELLGLTGTKFPPARRNTMYAATGIAPRRAPIDCQV
jgi:hypothetical protein